MHKHKVQRTKQKVVQIWKEMSEDDRAKLVVEYFDRILPGTDPADVKAQRLKLARRFAEPGFG